MTSPPTVANLAKRGEDTLRDAGIPDPRLDAELLLAHASGRSRVELATHPERPVDESQQLGYQELLKRRAQGEPVAYILGGQEFFGLSFQVDRRVLIPRPETEHLVEWALEVAGSRSATRIADLGTGSGCIAVALAVHLPGAEVAAVDLSPAALEVAAENVRAHGVEERVTLLEGDLATPLRPPFDLVVSNPPYVAQDDPQLEESVGRYEPAGALFDLDGDGLGFYRRLARDAPPLLAPDGWLLMEIGNGQHDEVTRLFEGRAVEVRRDLAGIERVVGVRV